MTRGIKDEEEKEKMRAASKINDQAMARFRELVKEGKMDFTVCQNAVNQANAAVDVAIMLSDDKSIKDYAGAADTGYQVWVDFEKVDASNVDDYLN